MLRLRLLIILSILLLGSLPVLGQACPDYIESGCDGGFAMFGLRYDGANVGQGQSVTLPCDSQIHSIDFKFRVTGNVTSSYPSMVAGDEVFVVLVDAAGNHLSTAMTALPADVFTDWLTFTFAAGLVVPAGEYKFLAYTTVPRNCSFLFCAGGDNDTYAGGQRYATLVGVDGLWFPMGNGDDVPFQLRVSEGLVANEDRSWGAVKGLYR
jgi:hypothetical protein